MGRTVAESVTPAGSGTAGLLLMKSALAAPAGACAAALRPPDEGAPRGLRRSDGSLIAAVRAWLRRGRGRGAQWRRARREVRDDHGHGHLLLAVAAAAGLLLGNAVSTLRGISLKQRMP